MTSGSSPIGRQDPVLSSLVELAREATGSNRQVIRRRLEELCEQRQLRGSQLLGAILETRGIEESTPLRLLKMIDWSELSSREIREGMYERCRGLRVAVSNLIHVEAREGVYVFEELIVDLASWSVVLTGILASTEHLPEGERRKVLRRVLKVGSSISEGSPFRDVSLAEFDALSDLDELSVASHAHRLERRIVSGDSPREILQEILHAKDSFFSSPQVPVNQLTQVAFEFERFTADELADYLNLLGDIRVRRPKRVDLLQDLVASQEDPDGISWSLVMRAAHWLNAHNADETCLVLATLRRLSLETLVSLFSAPMLSAGERNRTWVLTVFAYALGLIKEDLGDFERALLGKLEALVSAIETTGRSDRLDASSLHRAAELGQVDVVLEFLREHQDLRGVNRFEEQLALAYLRQGLLEPAVDAFCSLNLESRFDSYIPTQICLLARSLGQPSLVKRIVESLLDSPFPADPRLVTAAVRGSGVGDADVLARLFSKVVESVDPPSHIATHAFVEKFYLSSRADLIEMVVDSIPEGQEEKNSFALSTAVCAFLESDDLPRADAMLRRWFAPGRRDEDADWLRHRIRNYGDSLLERRLKDYLTLGPHHSPRRRGRQTGQRGQAISKVERDPRLARTVKEIHGHRCQVCGVVLPTPSGHVSEAAHIQPLGRPHNGSDYLENLLCLCPNHHKLFDAGGWYLDDDFWVVESLTRQRGTRLRIDENHPISLACLRYRRRITVAQLTVEGNQELPE